MCSQVSLINFRILSRKREKFENFIKDKGSETIITNPTDNKNYLNLCYLED